MLLPDPGMVHGRMLVTAWDFGLQAVDDVTVKVIMSALEVSQLLEFPFLSFREQ